MTSFKMKIVDVPNPEVPLGKNFKEGYYYNMKTALYTCIFFSSLFFPTVIAASADDLSNREIVGYIDFEKSVMYLMSKSEGSTLVEFPGTQLNLDAYFDEGSNCIAAIDANESPWLKIVSSAKPNATNDCIKIINFEKVKRALEKNGSVGLRVLIYEINGKVINGPLVLKNRIILAKAKDEDIDKNKLIYVPLKP